MSVEKVNEYKKKKAHRKENLAKERRRKKINRAAGWLICIALIALVGGLVGSSIYSQYKAYAASLPDYSVSSQVISDYTGVTQTEEAEEETAEAESEVETAVETETAAESEAETAAETAAADESAQAEETSAAQ